MNKFNKIVFLTGTRADYGKLRPLIEETNKFYKTYIYVCGMHLLPQFGSTYTDIIEDGFDNIYCANDISFSNKMDIDLANTIISFNKYINNIRPELIVVHGDRTDALAGAIVGMLNNILIAHIEGGEVTGTVDEAIRHSISKMSQYHFVANYESKLRLMQLGESEDNIFVIGSPDIDTMLSELPNIYEVKNKYQIEFIEYSIFIYHPVTTEIPLINKYVFDIINALNRSDKNYIIVYPNNDMGSEIIINEIEKLRSNKRYKIYKSLPFNDFLCLLKNACFIIGNSSAGIREACVYGVPAIDIGTRQNGRYSEIYLKNVQHVSENCIEILNCISKTQHHKFKSNYFGDGKSAIRFINALKKENITTVQKKFILNNETEVAIQNYINEVCF